MRSNEVIINKRVKTAIIYFLQDYADNHCFYTIFITEGGKGDFIFDENRIARFLNKHDVKKLLKDRGIEEAFLAIPNENDGSNIHHLNELYNWSIFDIN